MLNSDIDTDIFYKADKRDDHIPGPDKFDISPLLFKNTETSVHDITDTGALNNYRISINI